MNVTLLVILAAIGGAAFGSAIGYSFGLFRGERRGRELAACEPPPRGELHYLDGPIVEYRSCMTPEAVIERLTSRRAQ
jgi:hypothetical protein